ncbi:MAG: D-tyrosyl-tRNA(Tyr) deacylase [Oscillospiraceae bacterium]|jgi:D-tyrosyl-tRNA(Tyr) deacylase|nr:D-tyrosyl-tRNA(Tyr) deacylase [Oscillospiraceae bacterium]
MRAVIQRVTGASVRVDGETVGAIAQGLCVLVCVMQGDSAAAAELLADKVAKLRIFHDDAGKMNRSVLDVGGGVLAISQFTLAADTKKGNRPSFIAAALPALAVPLYEHFCARLTANGVAPVAQGVFGADMAVEIHNDGPVTICLDTDTWLKRENI